ncbi:MAG: hypothetical protein ACON5A_00080 [Candidatus Comchoanobacterales bacterium]
MNQINTEVNQTMYTITPRHAKTSLLTRIKRSITEFTRKFNFSTDIINRIKFTPGEFSFDENTLNNYLLYDFDESIYDSDFDDGLDFGIVGKDAFGYESNNQELTHQALNNAIYRFIYYLSGIITLPLLLIEYLIMPLPTIIQDGIHLMSTSIRLLVTLLIWSSVNIFTQALSIIPKLIIFAIAKTFNLVMCISNYAATLILSPFIIVGESLKTTRQMDSSLMMAVIIFPFVCLTMLIGIFFWASKEFVSAFLGHLFASSNAFNYRGNSYIIEFYNSIIPSFIDEDYCDDQTSIYSDLYHFIIDIITTPFKLLWYPLANLFSGNSLSESGLETTPYNKNQYVDSKVINSKSSAKYGSDDEDSFDSSRHVDETNLYNDETKWYNP